MHIKTLALVGTMTLAILSGCKLVKTSTEDANGPSADPILSVVENSFDAELVPELVAKAIDLKALDTAMAEGLEVAGTRHGVRVGGAGGAWNFAVSGVGNVLEENRQSKAGIANIDIDGDGRADAALQLGPVVKGTALRDVTNLYDFSQFRDQIEYARLGRALNDKAVSAIPEGDAGLAGKQVRFVGAVAIRSAGDLPLVTPVVLEVVP